MDYHNQRNPMKSAFSTTILTFTEILSRYGQAEAMEVKTLEIDQNLPLT